MEKMVDDTVRMKIENAYVTLSQAAPCLSKTLTPDLLQEQIKQSNNEASK